MASASHEEIGGDAVTIPAPPPTHPLFMVSVSHFAGQKNLNPQFSPLPRQIDCPTPKSSAAGEGGTLTTGDERLARLAHSLIDCGRPKDAAESEYTFGANYRLGELHAALLERAIERFPAQQAQRAELGEYFEELADGIPGVRINRRDERVTRWSFYRYIFTISNDEFGGAPNRVVAEALEAEGIPAKVQYPPMSRYDLFQPSLSRLPVCVEHADRLDPSR